MEFWENMFMAGMVAGLAADEAIERNKEENNTTPAKPTKTSNTTLKHFLEIILEALLAAGACIGMLYLVSHFS